MNEIPINENIQILFWPLNANNTRTNKRTNENALNEIDHKNKTLNIQDKKNKEKKIYEKTKKGQNLWSKQDLSHNNRAQSIGCSAGDSNIYHNSTHKHDYHFEPIL